MFDYRQFSPGEEGYSDAWDRLRYVEGRLDKSTAPTAAVIREYLTGDSEVVLETDDVGLSARLATGHRLLVRAAQACTDLGHPELQEYLYDETGDDDYAPQ